MIQPLLVNRGSTNANMVDIHAKNLEMSSSGVSESKWSSPLAAPTQAIILYGSTSLTDITDNTVATEPNSLYLKFLNSPKGPR
jgi:hypothetical protein